MYAMLDSSSFIIRRVIDESVTHAFSFSYFPWLVMYRFFDVLEKPEVKKENACL